MEVRETIYGTTVIASSEGMMLLDDAGGLSKEVFLAKGDDISNYREITNEEADAIMEASHEPENE